MPPTRSRNWRVTTLCTLFRRAHSCAHQTNYTKVLALSTLRHDPQPPTVWYAAPAPRALPGPALSQNRCLVRLIATLVRSKNQAGGVSSGHAPFFIRCDEGRRGTVPRARIHPRPHITRPAWRPVNSRPRRRVPINHRNLGILRARPPISPPLSYPLYYLSPRPSENLFAGGLVPGFHALRDKRPPLELRAPFRSGRRRRANVGCCGPGGSTIGGTGRLVWVRWARGCANYYFCCRSGGVCIPYSPPRGPLFWRLRERAHMSEGLGWSGEFSSSYACENKRVAVDNALSRLGCSKRRGRALASFGRLCTIVGGWGVGYVRRERFSSCFFSHMWREKGAFVLRRSERNAQ